MKITIKQLKTLITEQLEEMGATAGFVEHDGEQLDLPFSSDGAPNREERMNKLRDLEQELKHFDWYYMMSDDNHVYQTGSRMHSALSQKAKKLGKEGEQLFKQYSDKNQEHLKEESSVPAAPPVPIHEQGACAVITKKDMRPGNTSLEEETEEGCHEGYTGSPADGGGITGTQTTSGAADVVKEAFNRNASRGLNDLKKELDRDASKDLPPSKWKKCKVCKYSETNRPNGICRRCASNGNKIVGEQRVSSKKKTKK